MYHMGNVNIFYNNDQNGPERSSSPTTGPAPKVQKVKKLMLSTLNLEGINQFASQTVQHKSSS